MSRKVSYEKDSKMEVWYRNLDKNHTSETEEKEESNWDWPVH